jgi:hypothetical protein
MTYFFGKVKLPGSYFEVLIARFLLYPSSQRLISLYLITIYFNTSFLILFMFAMPTTRSLTVALNPPLVPPLDALNPLKVELDGEEVLVFACRPRSALHLCVRSVCAICVCVRSVCLPFVFVICVCDLCVCAVCVQICVHVPSACMCDPCV